MVVCGCLYLFKIDCNFVFKESKLLFINFNISVVVDMIFVRDVMLYILFLFKIFLVGYSCLYLIKLVVKLFFVISV